MPAVPERGAGAARECFLQCDAAGCGKWRRAPRAMGDALAGDAKFYCKDGRDGRFNRCEMAQEVGDDEVNSILDESVAADAEARERCKRDISNERGRMYQKRKRLLELERRHRYWRDRTSGGRDVRDAGEAGEEWEEWEASRE